jgi:hypothetical protein
MKQQEVLKKIGGIITELNEQYQYMQAEPEHLNSLELELFVANAHFLTDHAEILRKICNAAPPVKELPPVTEPEITPVIDEAPSAPVIQWNNVQTIVEGPQDAPEAAQPEPEEAEELSVPEIISQPEPEQVEPEPVSALEETPEPATPVTTEVPEPVPVPDIDLGGQADTYNYVREAPEPVTESAFSISSGRADEEPAAPIAGISLLGNAEQAELSKPEPTVAATNTAPVETQPEAPLTLNQRLFAQRNGGQPTATATAAASGKPVSDLASAVNLNDKLIFVKDLFNGYNLAYKEAIERLNRCKNFDEAERLLKTDYASKNNWAGKPTTADKFYALLHRRFEQ